MEGAPFDGFCNLVRTSENAEDRYIPSPFLQMGVTMLNSAIIQSLLDIYALKIPFSTSQTRRDGGRHCL